MCPPMPTRSHRHQSLLAGPLAADVVEVGVALLDEDVGDDLLSRRVLLRLDAPNEEGVPGLEDARDVGGHIGADALERADFVQQRPLETEHHLFAHVRSPICPRSPRLEFTCVDSRAGPVAGIPHSCSRTSRLSRETRCARMGGPPRGGPVDQGYARWPSRGNCGDTCGIVRASLSLRGEGLVSIRRRTRWVALAVMVAFIAVGLAAQGGRSGTAAGARGVKAITAADMKEPMRFLGAKEFRGRPAPSMRARHRLEVHRPRGGADRPEAADAERVVLPGPPG